VAAVLLSLASSLAFGLADYFGGVLSRRAALLAVVFLSQAAGLAVIGVLVLLRAEPFPGTDILPWTTLASIAGTAGIACLYGGLATGVMSVVAPIASTAAVIPVVVGAIRGETPSPLQNAGIALALGGVLLASRAPTAAGVGRRFARGAGLGILAAIFLGLFLVTFDQAAEPDPYWATLIGRAGSTFLLALAVLATRPSLRLGGPTLALVAFVGVLDVLGNTLFAVASTKGLVGVVSVLSSLYPVVTVALARALLGERLNRLQALGVAAAFAGVGLIAAG
jgi:drug/metabolite transporter (DMT)-like permease